MQRKASKERQQVGYSHSTREAKIHRSKDGNTARRKEDCDEYRSQKRNAEMIQMSETEQTERDRLE